LQFDYGHWRNANVSVVDQGNRLSGDLPKICFGQPNGDLCIDVDDHVLDLSPVLFDLGQHLSLHLALSRPMVLLAHFRIGDLPWRKAVQL